MLALYLVLCLLRPLKPVPSSRSGVFSIDFHIFYMFSRSPVPCSLPYLRILISFDKEVVPSAFWISAAPRGAAKGIRRAQNRQVKSLSRASWALLGVFSDSCARIFHASRPWSRGEFLGGSLG